MRPERVIDLTRYMYEQPPWYTVRDTFIDYSHERLILKGKDCLRAWSGFNLFMDVAPPQQEAAKLTTGQVEDFIELRTSVGGVKMLSVRRELIFIKAAFQNAFRRNRIAIMPYIELPDGQDAYRRPLSEDEFRLVMRQPMSGRLRRFYYCAYFTGHRSRAIEELTWDRVDFVRGRIDFNVPGRIVTNKRRCKDFPIGEDFMARLVAWKAVAKTPYVIGLGESGRCTETYHEAAYVVRELAGLKDPTLVPRHCMRKMFATELFEREANPEVVGRLMADDPATLRRNYVTFKQETLLAAANLRTKPMEVRT